MMYSLQQTCFKEVHLEVDAGDSLALVGESGAFMILSAVVSTAIMI